MKGMTVIVKTITRWVKCFILVFGLYIILYGHLTPGGGFAGGVILASSFILLTLAFGKETALKKLPKAVASELDSVGALMFLFIALMGMIFARGFFVNFIQRYCPGTEFRLYSAGIIPLCNIAVALKVGSSLFMIFIILSVLRVVLKGDKHQMIQNHKQQEGSK